MMMQLTAPADLSLKGAILEKVFPWVKNVEDLNDLEERLCSIARKAE